MLKTFVHRNITLLLVLQVAVGTSGCLKRVTIPVDKDHPVQNKVYYVYLKSGSEYLGECYLELLDPEFDDAFLSGTLADEDERVYIALDDIKTIEAVQQDKKKIVRGTVIGVAAFLAFGLILSTQSPIRIGSVD